MIKGLLYVFAAAAMLLSTPYKVEISQQNATVRSVTEAFTQQTGVLFTYESSIADHALGQVSVSENSPLETLLSKLFAGKGISFSLVGNTVVLTKTAEVPAPKTGNLRGGQSKVTVTGRLVDASGLGVIGASVIEKGNAGNGVMVDFDGNFSISVPQDAVLLFECIGYRTVEEPVAGRTSLEIVLEDDTQQLDEVVVVGYGVQKKVNLTGAVSSVTSKEFEDRPVVNVGQALQGMIPNLNITQGSGAPNAASTYNIRGNTSPNGGSPLILVDGVESYLERINANDIESISVLKDASSAAIYGARAAFGVILVTTKSGSADSPARVSASYRTSFSSNTASTDFETRGYYSAYMADMFMSTRNGVPYTSYTDYDYQRLWERRNDKTENPERPWTLTEMRDGVLSYVYLANFDWYHWLYDDTRPSQDVNVNVSGGSKNIKYMVSGRYYHQDGNFRIGPDDYDTYNVRAKLDVKIRPWLSLSSNTKFFNGIYFYHGNNYRRPTLHALASFVPVNPDGTAVSHTVLTNSSAHYIMDGYAAMMVKGKQWGKQRTSEVTSSTALKAELTKGLTLNADFSYKFGYLRRQYRDAYVEYSMYPGEILQEAVSAYQDRLSDIVYEQNNYVANAYAAYEKSWEKGHNFTATTGFNYESRYYKDLSIRKNDLLSEELSDFNLATGDVDVLTGGISEYALAGFFYRLTYNWKQRYFIESNGRYDGSSRFPRGHQWGFFPSVSGAWRFSEEPFVRNLTGGGRILDNGKLRFSYGSLGNQNIDYYEYYQTVSTDGLMNYTFDGEGKAGQAVVSDPVSSGTWETVVTKDAGIDLGFWKDKLTFSADAYIRDTKGILAVGKKLPSIYGATEPTVNSNDLRTVGWELQLGWKSETTLASQRFYYYFGAGLSDYKAWYTKADNPSGLIDEPYVGKRLGEIWGFRTGGLFATDEEAQAYAKEVDLTQVCTDYFNSLGAYGDGVRAGDIKFLDTNKDGVLSYGSSTTADPGDREVIGNSQPRYSYSFNGGFNWLGFDFYIMFQGIGHRDAYPGYDCQRFWGPYSRPYTSFVGKDFMADVWTEANPDAYFPRARGYSALNGTLRVFNDRYLQNAAYLRLKNLTLGYTLPEKLTAKAGLAKARVYFSGENLWYWTALHSKYLDPELVQHNGSSDLYAMSRTFSFGINVEF